MLNSFLKQTFNLNVFSLSQHPIKAILSGKCMYLLADKKRGSTLRNGYENQQDHEETPAYNEEMLTAEGEEADLEEADIEEAIPEVVKGEDEEEGFLGDSSFVNFAELHLLVDVWVPR